MRDILKYDVINADCPWHFKTFSEKGQGRSPSKHYATMTIEELTAFRGVIDNAADNCALAFWVTDPLLYQQMQIPIAWGFEYVTVLYYWAKTNTFGTKFPIGTGYYTRANPEQMLAIFGAGSLCR